MSLDIIEHTKINWKLKTYYNINNVCRYLGLSPYPLKYPSSYITLKDQDDNKEEYIEKTELNKILFDISKGRSIYTYEDNKIMLCKDLLKLLE